MCTMITHKKLKYNVSHAWIKISPCLENFLNRNINLKI